jgi:hypothetical protein
MRLVYTATQQEVKVGDVVQLGARKAIVDRFARPHSPESGGRVTVRWRGAPKQEHTCYVGVIGAEWIEREDRAPRKVLGLGVHVYRSSLGDCTNGGVSARRASFVLFDPDGPMEGYVEANAANSEGGDLLLVKRDKAYLGGYVYCVPAILVDGVVVEKPCDPRSIGWMAGGNFVGTSDSRFSSAINVCGAIPLHDRQESQELYDAMRD